MNNLGAEAARGEVLVFLNDDTEPLDRTWLERLVGQMERPGAGVAGAKLLYPSGTLQHGGVAVGVGYGCSHPGRNMAGAPPHWPWLDLSREVTAVTGACLAIRADLFRELSGFPEEFPVNFNDIDLCLRVRAAGRRVTYESGAILRHYECQSRRGVVTAAEYELFARRWGRQFKAGDPFYNPNLTVQNEDFSLASPLRGDDSPVRT
jgi:GT2 family glycosyltransferase